MNSLIVPVTAYVKEENEPALCNSSYLALSQREIGDHA